MIGRFIPALRKGADSSHRAKQREKSLTGFVRKFIFRWLLLSVAGLLFVPGA